jgi:hypothetical protein
MRYYLPMVCLVAAFAIQGCETASDYYPPAYGPLILAEGDACPDITGRYQANKNLLRLFKATEDDYVKSTLLLPAVNEVELFMENLDVLEFEFYSDESSIYAGILSEGDEYWCEGGMVAIRYESVAMPLTPGIVGFGTDTFYLARTTVNELVAKRVIKGTPMLLILPMPGGKHEVSWLRWKSAKTDPAQ